MYSQLKQSTARSVMVKLYLTSDHVTAATGKTLTVTLSKDGAAFGAVGGSVSEISSGWYKIALNTTDTGTLGTLVVRCTATSCDDAEVVFDVVAFDPQVAWAAASTALSTANWTTARAGYLDNINGHTAQTGDAYARLGAPAGASVSADIATRAASATALSTATWTGARAGYLDNINGHAAQTGDTFARLGAPVGASISADVAGVKTQTAAIETDTQDLQSRLPAALVSGRIDSSVGAMAADTLTASAIATDAVTEIQSGLATAAALATVDTVVDAIQAKTDNLSSDPADASDIAASFTTVNSTLSTLSGYVDTEVAAIKAKTDLIPASPAATGDIPSASTVAAAVWAYVTETGWSAVESLRVILSSAAGKLSGAATSSVAIRDVADTKNRIAATVDADGNRSAVTYDKS
jgi:hypothetical protein